MKYIKNKQLLLKLFVLLLYAVCYALTRVTGIGCIWKHVFGIDCPGCGYSRAVMAALRLNFAEAFSFHPVFWSFPILVAYFLADGKVFKSKTLNIAVIGVVLFSFAAAWIYKLII